MARKCNGTRETDQEMVNGVEGESDRGYESPQTRFEHRSAIVTWIPASAGMTKRSYICRLGMTKKRAAWVRGKVGIGETDCTGIKSARADWIASGPGRATSWASIYLFFWARRVCMCRVRRARLPSTIPIMSDGNVWYRQVRRL